MFGLLAAIATLIASVLDVQQNADMGANSRVSNSSASRKLEFIALLIPTIGVVALNQMVLTTQVSDISQDTPLDLVGIQWYWTFENGDVAISTSLAIGNLFALFLSNSVLASTGIFVVAISAVDVIHAIALPTLAVKADAIPGRCAIVKICSEISGTFFGQCSELCGSLHGLMPLAISIVIFV